MNIGIYSPYLDTLSGGERYMLSIASCLAQNKQNNVVIFWNLNQEEKLKEDAFKKLNIDLSNVAFVPNIFRSSNSSISRILKTRGFDYIFFLSDGSIPLVMSKLIVHFQFPVEWVNGSDLKTKIKLKRIKKIICNSSFTKSFIDNKFGVNSALIYPPVIVGKTTHKNKENIILHVGRLETQTDGSYFKKQDVLIEAFKKMKAPDWKLIFAISYRKEDESKFNDLKKRAENSAIEFVENPDGDSLWKLYSRSKIYWHATGFGEDLVKHPERAEHFGISTVEAMGAGVVPVVINAGGQIEIVENNKNGFLWNNVDELIEKTRLLISDRAFLESISREAQKKSKEFSEDVFCKKISEIIQ